MHSCETVPAPPVTGTDLLLQLGRLIIRSRSASPVPTAPSTPRDRLLQAKLLATKPSTSQTSSQVQQTQPKSESTEARVTAGVEAKLTSHVDALWRDQIPVCIEVLLAPECQDCYATLCRPEDETRDKHQQRALLLERWSMSVLHHKSHEKPIFITSQWLLNAVRSQLHFSQLSAWRSRLQQKDNDPRERRRKLSRETCNFKKLEANCDENELKTEEDRKLNIVYSIKIPGESYKMAEFTRQPIDHTFPITDIGNNVYLKVGLESLPRFEDIPTVRCVCQKRRVSKEMPVSFHEELTGKLNDLNLGPKYSDVINSNIGNTSRRLSIISNPDTTEYHFRNDSEKEKGLLDDRMHTTCSVSGKHKCSCDEESDGKENQKSSTSVPTKKIDERRLKEIAKYKRRLRKENKMKLFDSTSSEGEKNKETHTSIPILQAARFDRLRAIGCYRNQTYLTLPATRIECRSPFIESVSINPPEYKKTSSVSTQTDDFLCNCGSPLQIKCDTCKGMVRSKANYDLASLDLVKSRRLDDNGVAFKKQKCDNINNIKCDIVDSIEAREDTNLIKRPKLRRFYPIVNKIEKIVTDRQTLNEPEEKDKKDLHLNSDDSVFSRPKQEAKRQKTFSIGDDGYTLQEKCDYGTVDICDMESPIEDENPFQFPSQKDCINTENGHKNGLDEQNDKDQVPSSSEMDRFRWRFDSAASMVFHTNTGLPLTSSPAPLRRGKNSFDYDDSINGISGIKSALFHPPAARPAPPAPAPSFKKNKLRLGPSKGLLGSFEESALKGRLEAVATVHGFTAEIGASGSFCPPHKRLPVTVFFYSPGGTNAPYMGHIALGSGYRVPPAGSVQVSLFNPHGTLVKMFVVAYSLEWLPARARTFLRQRTLLLPPGAGRGDRAPSHVRYVIHLRFMTSKSGKLYLHTDIRLLVSRRTDLDTATAHSAILRGVKPTKQDEDAKKSANDSAAASKPANNIDGSANNAPNRFFGGCGDFERDFQDIGYENQNEVGYELRSFTYAPENPRYSPR